MKTIYIPKGETVSYENLVTDCIVVKGCLKVLDDIKAKSITGSGVIYAGTVSADDIRVDDLEAGAVTCHRLIAKRVQTPTLIASDSAAVSCYLASSYVEAGKLTVAASEICEVKADEIIHLTLKKRTLFGLLLVSAIRSLEKKDPELARIIAMFNFLRESGYTLKVLPGTPEENAPVFDFAYGKAA